MSIRRTDQEWQEILTRCRQALKDGTSPTFRSLAAALNLPYRTLGDGLQRYLNIRTSDELAAWARDQGAALPGSLPGQAALFNGIDPQAVLAFLRKRPLTLAELANALDRGQSVVDDAVRKMIAAGFGILRQEQQVSLPAYLPAPTLPVLYDQTVRRLTFAVLSDLHGGSKHLQASALLRFVRAAHDDYGVQAYFISGDLTAGVGVYRGQHNDLYAHSAEDQVASLVHTLPAYPDAKYYMLGGNHDYSFMKAGGMDVIRMACLQRNDFVYCGFDQVEIPLLENVSAVLWHPSGGVPYALSYRGQKMAAEIGRRELTDVVMEQKPSPTVRFIFWGHLHVSDFFPHGPIWVMGPGCFEGSNSYLKAKGLQPVVQGLVVEADVTPSGLLGQVHVHPMPFVEQEDDYHAAWEPSLARETLRLEPVFTSAGEEK